MEAVIITPSRGDRPQLLERCKHYASRQTVKCKHFIDSTPPIGKKQVDIVPRFQRLLDSVRADVVIVMEDDDYYAADYVERILGAFDAGTMAVGYQDTCYYHIKKRQYTFLHHAGRASLFTTAFRPVALNSFLWPRHDDPFLDIAIWKHFAKLPVKLLHFDGRAIGIKHGIGLCGGKGHTTMRLDRDDPDMMWLAEQAGGEALGFYQSIV